MKQVRTLREKKIGACEAGTEHKPLYKALLNVKLQQ